MKKPERRQRSKSRSVGPAPPGIDLDSVAEQVSYTGSVYHKDTPSFAGPISPPRRDASICPRDLAHDRETIEAWLRDAIRKGRFSEEWRGPFPHYVWHRHDGTLFEACLTNQGNGEYHGYPLEPDDLVEGIA